MKASIAGTLLAYETRGRGPALLLLHAFPLGQAMWDPQMEPLARRFQVVRFDARGFGGTPPGDGLLTMERIADDAVGVLDHLGLGRAVVCGLSMGGYAALALFRRHPGRVRGLALCDTKAPADTDEARQGRARLAEKVLREGADAAAAATVPKLLGATSHARRPEVVERVRAIVAANPPRGIANALHGLAARADSRPLLREISVPTLVVCGTEDVLTPPAEAEALHHGIAGSTLAMIADAGHLSNLEAPSAFNDALERFLTAMG